MKFGSRIINPFLKHCILVLLIFLSIFTIQRAALLLLNLSYFLDTPFLTLLQAFFVALRFDVRSSLYLIFAYYIFAYIFYFFNLQNTAKYFSIAYLSFSAYIFVLLGIVEYYFFDYFHIRLNAYTLNTLDNPSFVFQMLWETYPIIPLVLASIALLFLLYKLFDKITKRYLVDFKEYKLFHKLPGLIIVFLLGIIGLRGSLEIKTPLRWGHAFFSEYTKANQLALNYVFTLVDDISHKENKNSYKKHLIIKDTESAKAVAKTLIKDNSSISANFPLRTYSYNDSSISPKPNVVLILLESFSQRKIDKHTAKGYDLFINRLAQHSISFKNCYSNGFHTYMGLFSTISGIPNLHATNVMKRTEGRQEFSALPSILKGNGYTTYFGVSHVPNFDNMGGFMSINGTDKIISENDFDKSEVLSSLGVADHKLFEKLNSTFTSSENPFFATVLSTNNHGPWIIPEVANKSFENTFLYTDWVLEHFFEEAAKEPYFENTIFVITADHGIPENPIYDFDLSATHVPLLIYSPKFIKPQIRPNIMSHMDISETILGILKFPHKSTNFSKNILSLEDSKTGYALVQEGSKIGLIYNDWYLIDRLGSNSSLYKYKSENPEYDYSKDSTEVVKDIKTKLHSMYLLSNDMIYNMKASPKNY